MNANQADFPIAAMARVLSVSTAGYYAWARAYDTSEQRGDELPAFLFRYNWQRPHSGISRKTPISRLGLSADNLLMLHT